MDVAVTSVGPAIVEGIQDVDTKIHALVKSVSVYLYKMTVKITDADSPASAPTLPPSSSQHLLRAWLPGRRCTLVPWQELVIRMCGGL